VDRHTPARVVEDDGQHREAVANHGVPLLQVEPDRTVAGDLDDVQLSMLNDQDLSEEFMPVSDEEMKGVIDDYLYQLNSENQFN